MGGRNSVRFLDASKARSPSESSRAGLLASIPRALSNSLVFLPTASTSVDSLRQASITWVKPCVTAFADVNMTTALSSPSASVAGVTATGSIANKGKAVASKPLFIRRSSCRFASGSARVRTTWVTIVLRIGSRLRPCSVAIQPLLVPGLQGQYRALQPQ